MLSLTRADKLAISEAVAQAARKVGRPAQAKLRAGKNTYDVEYWLSDSKDHKTVTIRGAKKILLEDVNDVLNRFGFRSRLKTLDDQKLEAATLEMHSDSAIITEFLDDQKPAREGAGAQPVQPVSEGRSSV